MNQMLFGQCLGRVVNLSEHDVAEILEDQSASRRRFGEIALAWGLCQPEHVWRAWGQQLNRLTPEIDLSAVGIDAQALAHVPRTMAVEFGVVPVRSFGDQLVVAVDAAGLGRAANELPRLIPKTIKLVIASRDAINHAIKQYYSSGPAHRAVAG